MAQSAADGIDSVMVPLSRPEAFAVDEPGQRLFVADTGNALVRRVDQRTGLTTVIAGSRTAAAPPGPGVQPATDVQLGRVVAADFDAVTQTLFVSDAALHQVLAVQVPNNAPPTLQILHSGALRDPAGLAVHVGTGAVRQLFVVDRGTLGDPTARPRIAVLDLANNTRGWLVPNAEVVVRGIEDLCLQQNPDGSAHLFVLVDVVDTFGELEQFLRPDPNVDLDFETDGYDGLDGDNDGLIDAADADCREPMFLQVLRFDLSSSGLVIGGGNTVVRTAAVALRCFKRFTISVQFDPICGPPLGTSSITNLPGVMPERIAVDAFGRLFLIDPVANQIHCAEILQGALARTLIVAGQDSPFALPFDGDDPRATRLNRPRDLEVDTLGNLYFADTVNNRIRRAWIGGMLRND